MNKRRKEKRENREDIERLQAKVQYEDRISMDTGYRILTEEEIEELKRQGRL